MCYVLDLLIRSMSVVKYVFVCLSGLYLYLAVPVYFGGWYLADNHTRPQSPKYTTLDEDDPPENNTHSKGCTIRILTQEVMLACMDTTAAPATPMELA